MFNKLASAKPFLSNAVGGNERFKAAQATAKKLDNTAEDTDKRPGYVSVSRNDGRDTFRASPKTEGSSSYNIRQTSDDKSLFRIETTTKDESFKPAANGGVYYSKSETVEDTNRWLRSIMTDSSTSSTSSGYYLA